jgi:L-lactate utilization protein LutB
LPVLLMEPVSDTKRRRFFESLTASSSQPQSTQDVVKHRLKEIREYSLDHFEYLMAILRAKLADCPDLSLTFATDVVQAVETIKSVSLASRIVINKSTVVTNELKPALVAAGYTVIESYYAEFEPFDNRFLEYWQLPEMPFESRFQSFTKPVDLVNLRSAGMNQYGAKDFIGLLGVNAISAEDGTILFFQHMQNIRKAFTQARKVILVAGLDKIVKSFDEAIFQTKCMAAFGCEALPLTLHCEADNKDSLDTLPFDIPLTLAASKIHLILLDNGRSQMLKSSYRELLSCIDCQACIKDCPVSQYFSAGKRWSPRTYLYNFLTGKNPSLSSCIQCKTCEMNCPLGIDLPARILDVRHATSYPSFTDRLMANAGPLQSLGSQAADFVNPLFNQRLLRWLVEKTLNISRLRNLPRYQRRNFARWFKSHYYQQPATKTR